MVMFAIIAACGAIGGAVFWVIRRPDRDHAPPQD